MFDWRSIKPDAINPEQTTSKAITINRTFQDGSEICTGSPFLLISRSCMH
jgi:hypothetical protein